MRFLRQMPFLRFVAPFILGILICVNVEAEQKLWSIALIVFLLSAVFIHFRKVVFGQRWLFGFLMTLFFVALGFFSTHYNNELNNPQHFSQHLVDRDLFVEGQIISMPVLKNERIKMTVKVDKVGYGLDSIFATTGKLLVYADENILTKELEYGDQVFFQQEINEIAAPKNPEVFNYQRYLHFKNIHYQAFVSEGKLHKIDDKKTFSIRRYAFAQRKRFIAILKKYLPDTSTFSVGSALILGYKEEMDSSVRAAYAETGAMHVLAVSGLHVGLIYLILSFVFDKIFRAKRLRLRVIRALLCLCGIWAFALITGMSASVLRASVMFSVIICSSIFERNTNIYNSLAFSAFLLLLLDPYLLFHVGFQLSYLAVYGIVYFQPKFAALLICENKILDFFWQLLCVSLAAQFVTLPISLYYFHQFPLYFWLSGLIVVPAASIILSSGILLFVAESVFSGLGFLFGKFLYGIIFLVNNSIFFLQNLPGSVIKGIWISGISVIVLYIAMGFLINGINTYSGRNLVSASVFVLVFFVNSSFQKYAVIHNSKVVVYDLYKNSAIDFIQNNSSYLLINRGLSKEILKHVSDNYHFSQYVDKCEVFHIGAAYVENDCFLFNKNFVQFHDRTFCILTKMPQPVKEKLEIDYLIVSGNPNLELDRVLEYFDFKKIIIDNSNARYKVKEWMEYFSNHQIDCHYTAESGAWVLNM